MQTTNVPYVASLYWSPVTASLKLIQTSFGLTCVYLMAL